MGGQGLTLASKVSIMNANYIARRLNEHFPLLYKGEHGTVAHECIIDTRVVKAASGVEVEDTRRSVGDTLIWTDGDVTYRLESRLAMADAIRLAESLR